jgi:hypothetical protein
MGELIKVSFSGKDRGKIEGRQESKSEGPKLKYGVTLRSKDSGMKLTGLVITSADLSEWAEANNFIILAGFLFNTPPTSGQKTDLQEVIETTDPDPEVA